MEFVTSDKPVLYPDAVAAMEAHVAAMVDGSADERVWFLEHPPLYTAGTSAQAEDLVNARFTVFETGRGGQYTYHGPGQRVAYTMLRLSDYYPEPDIRGFVTDLEQWIINTLHHFDIIGERRDGRIGIWVVDPATGAENKIAALGIRVRRGISFHGVSINLNPDLSHFDGIVPCGIKGFGVTSLADLGIKADMNALDAALKTEFAQVFT